MNSVTKGFVGRGGRNDVQVPPGQYLTSDFPVLSAGPTPVVSQDAWELVVRTETGTEHRWDFAELTALGVVGVEADLHCVTGWSKLATSWRGVSLDAVLDSVGHTTSEHVLAHSYGGYTTNMPLQDLRDGQAWLVFEYDGRPLTPEHGGPVRLLLPHLYLWKSAKWVRGLTLMSEATSGFWEGLGYHSYGDPWQEQRYWGD
ncbi:MAG TPA: molybdopterin-dependent oxidoreductase [Nocardioidaceae bacterium]|jgi:DMSO/TMAO reductase YedYZ molybdopterin-dependent catalytic subunit|nr:molybdopterin-dependent oxidoreductase [Nocardioidaceae bacterium]